MINERLLYRKAKASMTIWGDPCQRGTKEIESSLSRR